MSSTAPAPTTDPSTPACCAPTELHPCSACPPAPSKPPAGQRKGTFADGDTAAAADLVRAVLIRRLEDTWAVAEPDLQARFGLEPDEADALLCWLMHTLFPEDYKRNPSESEAIAEASARRVAMAFAKADKAHAAAAAVADEDPTMSLCLAAHAKGWAVAARSVGFGGLVPPNGPERCGPDRLRAFAAGLEKLAAAVVTGQPATE